MSPQEKAISLAGSGFSPSQIAFKIKVPKTKVETWLESKIINNNIMIENNIKPPEITRPENYIIGKSLIKVLALVFCFCATGFLAIEASKVVGGLFLAVLLEIGILLLAVISSNKSISLKLLLGVATVTNILILTVGNFKSNHQLVQSINNNKMIAANIENTLQVKRKELQSLIDNKYIGRSTKVSAEITKLEQELREFSQKGGDITQADILLIGLVAITRAILATINIILAKFLRGNYA